MCKENPTGFYNLGDFSYSHRLRSLEGVIGRDPNEYQS